MLIVSIGTSPGYLFSATGYENIVAKYWKKGSAVFVSEVSKYSEASSIFLAKK